MKLSSPGTPSGSSANSTRSKRAPTRRRPESPDTSTSYRTVLLANRMCLCGILAAEYQTLPHSMRSAVRGFFERNETWLAGVLRHGAERGEVTATEPLEDAARLVIDTLEGAMMIARAYDGPERFDTASSRMIAGLLR